MRITKKMRKNAIASAIRFASKIVILVKPEVMVVSAKASDR